MVGMAEPSVDMDMLIVHTHTHTHTHTPQLKIVAHLVEAVNFLSGPLPYVWCHITMKWNVLSASLNKLFFPSFTNDNAESLIG